MTSHNSPNACWFFREEGFARTIPFSVDPEASEVLKTLAETLED